MQHADVLRTELRTALHDAMRSRDRDAVTALRGAIAAIDGAETVPMDGHEATVGRLGEVARRPLTLTDLTQALSAEVDEHERAASFHRERGDVDLAIGFETRARTVASFLPLADESTPSPDSCARSRR